MEPFNRSRFNYRHKFLSFLFQTSIKMKLLCVQVIKDMLSEGIDVSLSICLSLPSLFLSLFLSSFLSPSLSPLLWIGHNCNKACIVLIFFTYILNVCAKIGWDDESQVVVIFSLSMQLTGKFTCKYIHLCISILSLSPPISLST